jgi:4'-phosphopantetheinyl transferase
MKVFWLIQTSADLPENDDWLAAEECVRLQSMSVAKRRGDWRLGRWTAKRAMAAAWPELVGDGEPPADTAVVIRPAPDGAPEAFVRGVAAPLTVSISHSDQHGLSAVAAGPAAIGCDIEEIAERSDLFIEDYFTERERAIVGRWPSDERALAATLIWSAKESALKALREGLRLDTRAVEVSLTGGLARSSEHSGPNDEEWSPLLVQHGAGKVFHGLWRAHGRFVLTITADEAPEMIECRHDGACRSDRPAGPLRRPTTTKP